MTPDPISTIGLPRRVAAPLAYAGWWVTGVLFWFLERRDLYVRFHAAQACVAFGAIALVVTMLSGLAATSLMFMPNAFGFWVWTAGLIWVAGVASVARGDMERGNWTPVADSSCRGDCDRMCSRLMAEALRASAATAS